MSRAKPKNKSEGRGIHWEYWRDGLVGTFPSRVITIIIVNVGNEIDRRYQVRVGDHVAKTAPLRSLDEAQKFSVELASKKLKDCLNSCLMDCSNKKDGDAVQAKSSRGD
jgi:hypothetical protein